MPSKIPKLKWKGLDARFSKGKPFPHILIKKVIPAPIVRAVRQAVISAPKRRWDTDLYQMWQTDDLNTADDPALKDIVKWLTSIETKDSVGRITGEKALGHVDISGYVYEDTDHLLPHDDRLEGRRIAFIIYLTSSKKTEGGALDLFGPDGKPSGGGAASKATTGGSLSVRKSIVPSAGSIALFKVSKQSLHQVAEVCSKKPRITIGGWFNG